MAFLLALPCWVAWGELKLISFVITKRIILCPPHPTLSLWRGLKARFL